MRGASNGGWRLAIERRDDEGSGVAFFSVSGTISLEDLRAALSELYATRPPGLPRNHLWDFREAEVDWSSDEIRGFASWVGANRQPDEGRTAVVVATDFHFGLARMYEVFSSDFPVEFVVFRDLEAATAWVTR